MYKIHIMGFIRSINNYILSPARKSVIIKKILNCCQPTSFKIVTKKNAFLTARALYGGLNTIG